jgi:hypothetical protein
MKLIAFTSGLPSNASTTVGQIPSVTFLRQY